MAAIVYTILCSKIEFSVHVHQCMRITRGTPNGRRNSIIGRLRVFTPFFVFLYICYSLFLFRFISRKGEQRVEPRYWIGLCKIVFSFPYASIQISVRTIRALGHQWLIEIRATEGETLPKHGKVGKGI